MTRRDEEHGVPFDVLRDAEWRLGELERLQLEAIRTGARIIRRIRRPLGWQHIIAGSRREANVHEG